MPPPPSFDYYAELQVGRSASSTEITSAYRRLARIHHPDKNPDNQEEATTIFQRLQLAHETLSDPVKRARYDNGDDEPFDFDSDFDPFPSPFIFEFFFFFRMPPRPDFEQVQAAERQRRENEARVKREEQRQRQEAKEAREKEAKRSEASARRGLQDEELEKQEKRWEDMGAVSKDEKLRTCLHSDLCEKVHHTKKFRCTACSAKRGMTAFECPHCSASLCQLCVTTFSERRKRLETKEQMGGSVAPKDPAGMGDKPTSDEPDANNSNVNEASVNEANASEPLTGSPATKKPKKKKPQTKNAKTDGSSEQTPIPGKSDDNRKGNRQRDPGLSDVNEDETAPVSGASFASANPYDILTRDDKTTGRPGSVRGSPAGPTGGYIRTLGPQPMPPAAILRQAVEQFGAVRSLKITNKRHGTAHVDFATHDGLCRAMAASPVFVGETVKVRVLELKHCHTCGKAGHVAETCRVARRKTQEAA